MDSSPSGSNIVNRRCWGNSHLDVKTIDVQAHGLLHQTGGADPNALAGSAVTGLARCSL